MKKLNNARNTEKPVSNVTRMKCYKKRVGMPRDLSRYSHRVQCEGRRA